MREMLSIDAQKWFDRQDYDSIFLPWQIPLDHKPAFNELIAKGYLVETAEDLKSYKFAPDIVANNSLGELS